MACINKFSESEVHAILAEFKLKGGSLNRDEFKSVLSGVLKRSINVTDANSVFDEVDINHDGSLSFAEITAHLEEYKKMYEGVKDTTISEEEAALLKANVEALKEKALKIGQICEERWVAELPEASAILAVASHKAKVAGEAAGDKTMVLQGIIYMKGVCLLSALVCDDAAMQAQVDRLSKKHIETYGLTPARMALALECTEDVFIAEALASHKGEKVKVAVAWKKYFNKAIAMFNLNHKEKRYLN